MIATEPLDIGANRGIRVTAQPPAPVGATPILGDHRNAGARAEEDNACMDRPAGPMIIALSSLFLLST